MQIEKLHDGGVFLLTPQVFRDQRGCFVELFRFSDLLPEIIDTMQAEMDASKVSLLHFRQANLSQSRPFTLRGMHYQQHTQQGKLMRCVAGSIYQVCVDVRKGSPTLGQWIGTHLDAITHRAVYVPPGFANGFYAFGDGATVHYEMTAYYDAVLERTLAWDDPAVGIKWPIGPGAALCMSAKDRAAPRLDAAELWEAKT